MSVDFLIDSLNSEGVIKPVILKLLYVAIKSGSNMNFISASKIFSCLQIINIGYKLSY